MGQNYYDEDRINGNQKKSAIKKQLSKKIRKKENKKLKELVISISSLNNLDLADLDPKEIEDWEL